MLQATEQLYNCGLYYVRGRVACACGQVAGCLSPPPEDAKMLGSVDAFFGVYCIILSILYKKICEIE